jgi:hypothetical protein
MLKDVPAPKAETKQEEQQPEIPEKREKVACKKEGTTETAGKKEHELSFIHNLLTYIIEANLEKMTPFTK